MATPQPPSTSDSDMVTTYKKNASAGSNSQPPRRVTKGAASKPTGRFQRDGPDGSKKCVCWQAGRWCARHGHVSNLQAGVCLACQGGAEGCRGKDERSEAEKAKHSAMAKARRECPSSCFDSKNRHKKVSLTIRFLLEGLPERDDSKPWAWRHDCPVIAAMIRYARDVSLQRLPTDCSGGHSYRKQVWKERATGFLYSGPVTGLSPYGRLDATPEKFGLEEMFVSTGALHEHICRVCGCSRNEMRRQREAWAEERSTTEIQEDEIFLQEAQDYYELYRSGVVLPKRKPKGRWEVQAYADIEGVSFKEAVDALAEGGYDMSDYALSPLQCPECLFTVSCCNCPRRVCGCLSINLACGHATPAPIERSVSPAFSDVPSLTSGESTSDSCSDDEDDPVCDVRTCEECGLLVELCDCSEIVYQRPLVTSEAKAETVVPETPVLTYFEEEEVEEDKTEGDDIPSVRKVYYVGGGQVRRRVRPAPKPAKWSGGSGPLARNWRWFEAERYTHGCFYQVVERRPSMVDMAAESKPLPSPGLAVSVAHAIASGDYATLINREVTRQVKKAPASEEFRVVAERCRSPAEAIHYVTTLPDLLFIEGDMNYELGGEGDCWRALFGFYFGDEASLPRSARSLKADWYEYLAQDLAYYLTPELRDFIMIPGKVNALVDLPLPELLDLEAKAMWVKLSYQGHTRLHLEEVRFNFWPVCHDPTPEHLAANPPYEVPTGPGWVTLYDFFHGILPAGRPPSPHQLAAAELTKAIERAAAAHDFRALYSLEMARRKATPSPPEDLDALLLGMRSSDEVIALCEKQAPFRGVKLPRASAPEFAEHEGHQMVKRYTAYPEGRSEEYPTAYGVHPRSTLDGAFGESLQEELEDVMARLDAATAHLPSGTIVEFATWDGGHIEEGPNRFLLILGPPDEPFRSGPYRAKVNAPKWACDKMALAKLRLLPFFFGRTDLIYHISNARPYQPWEESFQVGSAYVEQYQLVSCTYWLTPGMENVWGYGSSVAKFKEDFSRALAYGLYIYGADEAILLQMGVTFIQLGTHLPATPLPWNVTPYLDYQVRWTDLNPDSMLTRFVSRFTWKTIYRPVPYAPGDRSQQVAPCPSLYCRSRTWLDKAWRQARGSFDGWDLEPHHDFVRVDNLFAPVDRSAFILFVTYGSRGDQVPVEYLARCCVSLGMPAAVWCAGDIDPITLMATARGDFTSSTSSFLGMCAAGFAGWKHVVYPFSYVPGNTTRFSLDSGPAYTEPFYLGETFLGKVASWLHTAMPGKYRIGVLSGHNTGRSHDGYTLLKPAHCRNASTAVAVTAGSEGEDGIPDFYKRYERLPSGDHLEIMPNYGTIYCHGGAGTMQTAICSGAEAISFGTSLDRRYKRTLTPRDARATTPAALMIELAINTGTVLPWPVYKQGIIEYITANALPWLATFLTRLSQILALGLTASLWMPTITALVALGMTISPYYSLGLVAQARNFAKLVLDHPTLLVDGPIGGIGLALSGLMKLGPSLVASASLVISSQWRVEHYIVSETLPLPGHIVLRNTKDGRVYEGKFVLGKARIGGLFKMYRSDRPPGGHTFSYPIIVDEQALRLSGIVSGEYGEGFNCITLARRSIGRFVQPATIALLLAGALGWLILLFWRLASYLYPGLVEMPALGEVGPTVEVTPEELLWPSAGEPPTSVEATSSIKSSGAPMNVDIAPTQSLEPIDSLEWQAALLSIYMHDVVGCDDEEICDELAIAAVQDLLDAVPIHDTTRPLISKLRPAPPLSLLTAYNTLVKELKGVLDQSPEFASLLVLLKQCLECTVRPVYAILKALFAILEVCSNVATYLVIRLSDAVHVILDHVLPDSGARERVKSIWTLGGTTADPRLTAARRYLQGAELMKARERTQFDDDFRRQIDELIDRYNGKEPDKIGGKQHRPISGPKHPQMALTEMKALNIPELQARVNDILTERAARYISMGAQQGADGAWLGKYRPDSIDSSLSRYGREATPAALHPEERDRAWEAAQALVDQYPEALTNCDLTYGEAVWNYLKHKYSPGSPFVRHYESRQAMADAGWVSSMLRLYKDRIKTGEYPIQFYHAFPKSQVVDIKAVNLRGKPIRTVVAQDLASYFVDQFFQFERNKRVTWESTGVGSGMPLNQSMEPLFKAAAEYKVRLGLDATQFDSTIGPWGFEALSALAYHGFKGQDGGTHAYHAMRAKYDAMQKAYIIAITKPDSDVFVKDGGGGTGQSSTTWDNTWAMKSMVIAAWADTYDNKRPMREFFDDCSFVNTSDDNIFATKDEHFPVAKFIACAARYGLILRIETQGEIEDISYLGKRARVPNQDDLRAIHHWQRDAPCVKRSGFTGTKDIPPAPELVVYQDMHAILMRRTGLRYYQSQATELTRNLIQRSVGHGYLTAFDPFLHSMFQNEYVQDAKRWVGKEWQHLIRLSPNAEYDNRMQVEIANDPRVPQSVAEKLRLLRKSLRYPAYHQVVMAHMRPTPPTKGKATKLRSKLYAPLGKYDEDARRAIQALLDAADAIPRELKRYMPGPDMIYPDALFPTVNCHLERFMYTFHRPDSFSSFNRLIGASPYAGCTDAPSFWTRLADPEFVKETESRNPQAYRGMAALVTLVYWGLWAIINWLETKAIIGLIVALFQLTFVKLPHMFMVIGLLSWHITGAPSPIVGRLMPRDMYLKLKQVAAGIVDLIPAEAGLPIGYAMIAIDWVPPMLDEIASWYVRGASITAGPGYGESNSDVNEWHGWAPQIVDRARSSGAVIVKARTATGKSTWLVAALAQLGPRAGYHRIWHLVPRKVLRDNTTVPFNISQANIKRGDTIGTQCVLRMTYGHYLNRLDEVGVHDLVLFDEFHEETGEMVLAYASTTNPKILLSATPSSSITGGHVPTVEPTVKGKGFAPEIHEAEGDAVVLYQQAQREFPEQAKRALVIVPTLKEVDRVIAGLEYLKVPCTEFSSRQRNPPPEGVVVATQMVDAGFDLKPPANLVVDTGYEFVVDKGISRRQPSRPANALQRAGRTGRLAPGIVVRNPVAGTGPEIKSYPGAMYFSYPAVAAHFNVPLLETVDAPFDRDAPFWKYNTHLIDDPNYLYGLTFFFYAMMSGIRPDQMPLFYERHARLHVALDEDYEPIDSALRRLSLTNRRLDPPEWAVLLTTLNDKPYTIRVDAADKRVGWIAPIDGNWEDPTMYVPKASTRMGATAKGKNPSVLLEESRKRIAQNEREQSTFEDRRPIAPWREGSQPVCLCFARQQVKQAMQNDANLRTDVFETFSDRLNRAKRSHTQRIATNGNLVVPFAALDGSDLERLAQRVRGHIAHRPIRH
uniref:Replicase n=1 Tax=Rhizoctonia solani hypovirus 5 TaxID=2818409 RepID=A0AAU7PF58_9VIRU